MGNIVLTHGAVLGFALLHPFNIEETIIKDIKYFFIKWMKKRDHEEH